MKKKYNKLVRDKIPEIIERNNETPHVRILNNEEFKIELEKKLYEEYKEVLSSEKEERKSEKEERTKEKRKKGERKKKERK